MSKYVTYVGSYTHGESEGIHIYDIDVLEGQVTKRKDVKASNPYCLIKSRSNKYVYTIADDGISAYKIEEDGDLTFINTATIKGMRASHLYISKNDRFIITAGYHDGKVTVLNVNSDGSVGSIVDEVYHKGLGSVAERSYRPHVSCVVLTPDEKYLCAVDLGIDQIKLYEFNSATGKIRPVDILRCELESAPKYMIFSEDGKYAYVNCELKNYVSVYEYCPDNKNELFRPIQNVSTMAKGAGSCVAACAMRMSEDGEHLFCSNAGDNTVAVFKIDKETGELDRLLVLPISGEYPRDLVICPDKKHVLSLNQETSTITSFTVDYDKNVIMMNGNPKKAEMPTCGILVKLD